MRWYSALYWPLVQGNELEAQQGVRPIQDSSEILVKELLRGDTQGRLLDTPFESPAEYEFAYHLLKHVRADVAIAKQYPAPTERGQFRLDFLLARPGKTLAIEIDGQPYHNYQRDAARDALVLAAGHADEVIRILARGVAYHVEDVLYLLSEVHSPFFSARARDNLRILSSPYARLELSSGAHNIAVYYPLPDQDPDLVETYDWGYETPPLDWRERDLRILGQVTGEEFLGVLIERRAIGFGQAFLDFARANAGLSFDSLVNRYFTRT